MNSLHKISTSKTITMYSILLSVYFIFSSLAIPEVAISAHYNETIEDIVILGLEDFESKKTNTFVSVYYGEVNINTEQSKVLGISKILNENFVFKSKYGFSNGASYTVFVKRDSNVELRFIVKVPEIKIKPSTYIKNVYPTSSKLPMNQLKFYIEFSAPMRLGNAFEHIHLYKLPEGKLESEAFLVTAEELWNSNKTRVTIFFDPGRIKRGVQPNLQLGLPLIEGNTYRLVIDKEWLDINDVNLIKGFEKTFDVISVDRESPSPENWKIYFPNAKNKSPIKIDFKEAMDFGLLHSAIAIVDENNNYVEGITRLSENENKWMFTPKREWLKGNYKMIINAWLEDLSGNNLNRKFDVNLNSENDKPKNIKEVIIPFEIN